MQEKEDKLISIDTSGILDQETGEFIPMKEVHSYTTEEQYKIKVEKAKRQKELEEKKRADFLEFSKYGNFIWNVYTVNEENFPNISPATITRLMFISTYLGYDGYLVDKNKNPLQKNDINVLLNLKKFEFYKTYNELTENNILIESNGVINLNREMFDKGALQDKDIMKLANDSKYITRLYVDSIRKLYNSAFKESHKTLSYLFKIMPYINREYNVFCSNPLEKDLSKVRTLNIGDFCDRVKYNKKNARRLQRMLFDPVFQCRDEVTSAIRCVEKDMNVLHDQIFINPNVYYAGTHWKEVEILGKF